MNIQQAHNMQRSKTKFAETLEARLALSALSLTYNGTTVNNGDTIEIAEMGSDDALRFRLVASERVQSQAIGEACVHVTKFELPGTMQHNSTPLGCLPAGAARAVDVVIAENGTGPGADDYKFALTFESDGVEEQVNFTAIVQDRVDGDTDQDRDVDFADFLTLQASFGEEVSDGHLSGDFDLSGIVDFADFLILSENFGQRVAAERGDSGEFNPAGNLVPRAWADAYKINQKAQLTVDADGGVLSNDANQFGQFISSAARAAGGANGLKAELIEAPEEGTVTFNSDGSFEYIPPSEFIGVAEFTYVPISERRGVPQRVSITVLSEYLTQSQTAKDDTYFTSQDTVLVIDASSGVIKNDNAEADPLKAAIFEAPENGTVTLDASGAFVYTPDPNFRGVDTFSYVANDQYFSSQPATVTIRVS